MNAAGGYRTTAAGPTVTLGPLPFRFVYLIVPIMFTLFGVALVGCAGLIVTTSRPETVLQCKRTPVGLACDEWIEKKHTRHFESAMRFVSISRLRSGTRIYVAETISYTPANPDGALASLQRLQPGQEVVLDVTTPRPIALPVFTALGGILLVGGAVVFLVSALRRQRGVVVHVTPRSKSTESRRSCACPATPFGSG